MCCYVFNMYAIFLLVLATSKKTINNFATTILYKNMKVMSKQKLAQKIYEVSYIQGKFLLRSGQISNEYFDKYQFESHSKLLYAIAKYIQPILPDDFDFMAALEMGGIPIATALGLQTGKSMVFVRKEAKKYGTAKLVEGPDINDKKLLIIEDVVTSGGQIISSVDELRKAGAIIEKAVCVIDREQGGKEALKKHGIELISLFTMEQLKEFGN